MHQHHLHSSRPKTGLDFAQQTDSHISSPVSQDRNPIAVAAVYLGRKARRSVRPATALAAISAIISSFLVMLPLAHAKHSETKPLTSSHGEKHQDGKGREHHKPHKSHELHTTWRRHRRGRGDNPVGIGRLEEDGVAEDPSIPPAHSTRRFQGVPLERDSHPRIRTALTVHDYRINRAKPDVPSYLLPAMKENPQPRSITISLPDLC